MPNATPLAVHFIAFLIGTLISATCHGIPVSVSIPITVIVEPHAFFDGFQITGYQGVDGGLHVIPNAPVMRQGDHYRTPILELGEMDTEHSYRIILHGALTVVGGGPLISEVVLESRIAYEIVVDQASPGVYRGRIIELEIGFNMDNPPEPDTTRAETVRVTITPIIDTTFNPNEGEMHEHVLSFIATSRVSAGILGTSLLTN